MKWIKNNFSKEDFRSLTTRYEIEPLLAAVLLRRDIKSPHEVCFYLETDVRYTHNPFLLDEIEDCIDRIKQARSEGEKVLVYGDRDVDGITSIVIIVETLKNLGVQTSWDLPMGDDTYGLSKQRIKEFAENDGTLIVTVDCGTSSIEEVLYARELGVDIIIIDHHNIGERVPASTAFINPKHPEGGYPFTQLAGCAVAAKTALALRLAETEVYNRPVCLLNIRPGNESYVIEGVKLLNMIEIERIHETIIPGMVDISQTRLLPFLSDQEIYLYDETIQGKMLQRIFGTEIEINVSDLAPVIWEEFPQIERNSLFKMRQISRMARYFVHENTEIDIFKNLFISLIMKKHKAVYNEFFKDLDLVALGSLSDIMPLVNENRILVRKGMDVLKKSERAGIRELMLALNLLGKHISTKDVSWKINPAINATGRMGQPDCAVKLLLADTEQDKAELAKKVLTLNEKRKLIAEETWAKMLPEARDSLPKFSNKLSIVCRPDIHRGISGILASRLVKTLKQPAIVMAQLENIVIGSLRSIPGFDVHKFISQFEALVDDFGGHNQAAGFSMRLENIRAFYEKLKLLTSDSELEIEACEEPVLIDAELKQEYMDMKVLSVLDALEPYGNMNAQLVFLSKNLPVERVDVFGRGEKSHLKLVVNWGSYKVPAIYWNRGDLAGTAIKKGDTINAVYHISRDTFQNNKGIQLTIVDVKQDDTSL